MRIIATLAVILILTCQAAYAQTVSVIGDGSSTESSMVEASMKRYLRAEGYTVKGSTNEGIVLMLRVIPLTTKGGQALGLAAHVTVLSVGWQEFADTMVSESCKEDHELAHRVTDYLGTRIILHSTQVATASDAAGLAEMLLEGGVNSKIREIVRKKQKFFDDLDKKKDEQTKDVINPYR